MKIFKQETNKSCGVACLRSILNHYGNDFSEKDVWEKNDPFNPNENSFLNPIICLGVNALKFGFDVEYYGYNPIIANYKKSETLENSLREKSKNYFNFGKYEVDKALEFLKLGGKINIDKLKIIKIKKLLDKNKFLLVEIRPAFLNMHSSPNMNHKVILTEYTKKGFNFLNPSDGKKCFVNFDDFLLAFYAAMPELLVIRKRKK